ncbi:DUF3961 domain-containing protein [Bacillus cytotoxicus]
MQKLNEFFGLESRSDRIWYYGVFGVGGTLYAIDMFIAYVL